MHAIIHAYRQTSCFDDMSLVQTDRQTERETRKTDRTTGQDRTGQDRTGQDRTGQDRTGQDKTSREAARKTSREAARQTSRWTDGDRDGQMGRQNDKQVGWHWKKPWRAKSCNRARSSSPENGPVCLPACLPAC